LRLLAPARGAGGAGPDLCVVGDDDQSIYAFRGADDRAFQRFSANWAGHETVELSTNYRSAPCIIDAANATISRAAERFAPDKRIEPAPGSGGAVETASVEGVEVENDGDCAVVIAAMIMEDQKETRRALRDYAVIVRTNAF